MAVVPSTRVGKVEFYESHVAAWAANRTGIGLSDADVAAVEAKTAAARAKYEAQRQAIFAARAATAEYYRAVADLADCGSGLIQKIKATAAAAAGDEDGVYALALIPPPAEPSPVPAPGTPTGFTFRLAQVGSLTLAWKCRNPANGQGTVYEVRRSLGDAGAFAYVGVSGVKKFVDETLPAGCASVTYEVTAVRSTRRGSPARFVINFGTGGAVLPTAAGMSAKLAA